MCARCSSPHVSGSHGLPFSPRLLASGWFCYESSSKKKFFGSARYLSNSWVNSYTWDCGSWMLMHFERIHGSRSDENEVMNVHLAGSTPCGYAIVTDE